MSAEIDEAVERDPSRSRFVRTAAIIGDLDSPFYGEERDRDVWNEASAVGFQVLLWGIPLVAAVALWLAGAAALVPVGLILLLWGAAAGVVLTYAQRFGVDPSARTSLVEGRRTLFLAVIGLLGTGVVRGALDLEVTGTSLGSSFLRGMGQGAAATAGVLCLVLTVLLIRDRFRS